MTKIRLDMPVIVEGKYDVIKLNSIIDGQIIKTDGFSLFNSEQDRRYIQKIAEKNGVIVLTDSDGAGLVIRNHLNSILPKDKIVHLYCPCIEGKEKRKKTPSKEGYLGVEGIDADTLRSLFAPFETKEEKQPARKIEKTDLYLDGLIGGNDSSKKRRILKKRLSLPDNISSNALLGALNLLYSYEEYKEIIKDIINTESDGKNDQQD